MSTSFGAKRDEFKAPLVREYRIVLFHLVCRILFFQCTTQEEKVPEINTKNILESDVPWSLRRAARCLLFNGLYLFCFIAFSYRNIKTNKASFRKEAFKARSRKIIIGLLSQSTIVTARSNETLQLRQLYHVRESVYRNDIALAFAHRLRQFVC